MGILSNIFDGLGETVDDFFGFPTGSIGEAVGLVGKAGLKALSNKKEAIRPFPKIPSFNTQTLSTASRSDAEEVKFSKSMDMQQLHNEWLNRMARFSILQKITER